MAAELEQVYADYWEANLKLNPINATFIGGLCCELHRVLSHLIVTDEAGAEWPQFLVGLSDWLAARVRPGAGGALRTDSRQVQPGDAFIAWPGYATDGRRFVPAALAAGAVACLVEAEGAEALAAEFLASGIVKGWVKKE